MGGMGESDAMIHNNHPSNPQQPIHSLGLAPVRSWICVCVMKIWKKMFQNSLRHGTFAVEKNSSLNTSLWEVGTVTGPMGTNGPRFLVAGLEGQNLGLSNDVVYLTSAEEGGRTEVHLTQNLGWNQSLSFYGKKKLDSIQMCWRWMKAK